MKKKVIVVSQAMYIGGAERALLGLLNSFDYSKYDVDLFLMRQEGELLNLIPSQVNLLNANDSRYLAISIKQLIKDKKYSILFGRMKAKILSKFYLLKESDKLSSSVELDYSHKYTVNYIQNINSEITYDLCISFLTPHYIAIEKVKAKKKIAWIHTDYSTVVVDKKSEYEIWSKFDYIASISDDCTKSFLGLFPSLEEKIVRIDNIVTADMIMENVHDHVNDMQSSDLKFLSIGRFTHQKNFENVPEICSIIRNQNINVKWYLIGFGMDQKLIEENIRKYNMEDYVIILGKKDNPYPYIYNCDIYLQPSRFEGKSVAVREAQMLKKPVIITDYPTASNQVDNGVDGIIVPMDNEACAFAIADIIKNKKLDIIKDNLNNINYDNDSEIEKIYKLINE